MPGTRRTAWRTTAVAMLLALQLVVAPTRSYAQDAVDTTPSAAAPTDATPAASESPDVAQPTQPLTTEVVADPMPAETTSVADAPTRSRLAPYALWGTSVVSLALGTVFGVMALSAKKDFNDAPTYQRADKVHNLGIAADTGLGLGLLLAITGTVFYFVGHDSDRAHHGQAADARTRSHTSKTVFSALRIAPLVSHHARGGILALRF